MPDAHREAAVCHIAPSVAASAPGAGLLPAHAEWRALLCLLYVVVGATLIVTSIAPLTLTVLRLLAVSDPAGLTYETCARLVLGLALVALALAGGLLARAEPLPARHPLAARPVVIVATAFPAGIAAVALALAAAWACGVAVGRPHAGVSGAGLFASGSGLILLGVVAEELLLRGLLQPILVRCWGPVAGVPVCALAFMVIHMVGGWGHPVSLLNIFLAGIWFGLLAWRTGGLAAPVLAHFGYNWAEEMVFGASPNPGVGSFGSAFDIDLTGAAIWGGSMEGLNASLVVSLLLVALIIPLATALRSGSNSGGGARTRP